MRANILALADVYAEHRNLTQKTLSGYCHGDPPFLEKLRDGSGVTGRKYDVVIGWFFDNWPDDLEMPKLAVMTGKAPAVRAKAPGKARRPKNGSAAARQAAAS